MEIPKEKVLDLLKQQGKSDQAEQANHELPDQVDPERDSGLLSKFGVEPRDLLAKLGGNMPVPLGPRPPTADSRAGGSALELDRAQSAEHEQAGPPGARAEHAMTAAVIGCLAARLGDLLDRASRLSRLSGTASAPLIAPPSAP